MKIIGTGVGRTGTFSLRLAIDALGFGPCHHMEVVVRNMDPQVNLWTKALEGKPDWAAIYKGHSSAVDWPTAAFYKELYKAFPTAKFILGTRDPENWADSFGSTIYKLMAGIDQAPEHMQEWLQMCLKVTTKCGFPLGLDRDQLIKGFIAHNDAVKQAIPAEQLLVYSVKDGWEPLCQFLGVSIPNEAFPRTNNREEFWELIKGAE